MKKRKAIIYCFLLLSLLFLAACGKGDTTPTEKQEKDIQAEAEGIASDEAAVEVYEESIVDDSAEKYDEIIKHLKNEDYDGAIALINAMRPAPMNETITITQDNWSTYFSIEDEYSYSYDAQGVIEEAQYHIYLRLKDEYKSRMISLSGIVGYEYDYVPHLITDINKEDGSIETEIADNAPGKEEFEHVSTTENLSSEIYLSSGDVCTESGNTIGIALYIDVKDAENMPEQWLYYPEEINIVRIEGELVLQ